MKNRYEVHVWEKGNPSYKDGKCEISTISTGSGHGEDKIFIVEDTNLTSKVLDFLKLYKVEGYIYPNVFVNKCKISLKESYDIMDVLRTNGYVKPVFALCCFKCQKFVTGPYDNLNEIPEDIECDFCDETVNIVDNIVTYYEVIKQLGENDA